MLSAKKMQDSTEMAIYRKSAKGSKYFIKSRADMQVFLKV